MCSDNRTTAVHAVQAVQRALPVSVELWLGGHDAAAVAACIKSNRGMVVTSLPAAESEFTRVAGVSAWYGQHAVPTRGAQ